MDAFVDLGVHSHAAVEAGFEGSGLKDWSITSQNSRGIGNDPGMEQTGSFLMPLFVVVSGRITPDKAELIDPGSCGTFLETLYLM